MAASLENEDKKIVDLLDGAATVLIFMSKAYSNYVAYSFVDYKDAYPGDLSIEPLKFSRFSFQYCLIVQFCKLFEPFSKKNTGSSSLRHLNSLLTNKYPEFLQASKKNKRLINEIVNNQLFLKIKDLRNKSYAHSDSDSINKLLGFTFLTKQETDEFREIMLKAIAVYATCKAIYGITDIFHIFYDDLEPKKFLTRYFRNKKYYINSLGKTI